ncbi:MAG: hypothetical protein WA040_11505 [Anaerolineae bacterium]
MSISYDLSTNAPISKPMFQILTDLTRESRIEVALPLAIKDLVRLKLADAARSRLAFEQQYGIDFEAFRQAWEEDRVADKHSYDVGRDYWEWEAAVTDEQRLQQMIERLS